MEDKPAIGTLTITVKKATLTHDTEAFGKMDPYVRLIVGKVEQKTKVKNDVGKTPEWNETFEFGVRSGELIDVTIWDKEDVGSDDFVGGAKIIVNAETMKVKQSTWYPIYYGNQNKDKGGEVLLEVEFTVRDEKNVLVTMLEGRKTELIQLQTSEKSLKEEVQSLKDKVNALTHEKEQLKNQFQEERNLLIKSYESQKEGLQAEKNQEVALIEEISGLKEQVRALQIEKAALQKNEEKSQTRIRELGAEAQALKNLLVKPTPKPTQNNKREVEVVSLLIFGIYFVGSLVSKH